MCTVLLTKGKVCVCVCVCVCEREREGGRKGGREEGREGYYHYKSRQIHILQEDMSRGAVRHITCCEVTAVERISVDHHLPYYCTVVGHTHHTHTQFHKDTPELRTPL